MAREYMPEAAFLGSAGRGEGEDRLYVLLAPSACIKRGTITRNNSSFLITDSV